MNQDAYIVIFGLDWLDMRLDETFREEVHDRATRIARSLRSSQPEDLAERLAIERTLERMGYLRQEVGGWC